MERAAANCYNSEPTKACAITKACIKLGHTSVTEFGDFVFHVEGVSRSLLAQLTRHRHASFAVRSQRYCVEDGFQFVTPNTISKDKKLVKKYEAVMKVLNDKYMELVAAGVPKEDARYILPNACCTELEVKMNFRELMHFCGLRRCMRAQWEIRELADAMAKLVEMQIDLPAFGEPVFSKYLVPKCEQHEIPYCDEKSSCGRHPKLKELLDNGKECPDRNEEERADSVDGSVSGKGG